jgi:hypothetical protein
MSGSRNQEPGTRSTPDRSFPSPVRQNSPSQKTHRYRTANLAGLAASQVRPGDIASVTQLASLRCHISNAPRHPIRGWFRGQFDCPLPRLPAGSAGGGERDRTDDLLLAKQALSQLSYTPLSGIRSQGAGARMVRACLAPGSQTLAPGMVGQGGFEPPTSRLSSARSNQLSY